MKKVVKVLVSSLEDALEEALEEALKQAWKKLWDDVGEPVKPKRTRAKVKDQVFEEEAPQLQPEPGEPKAKTEAKTRRKGPKADGAEVRRLIKALADLGAAVGPREAELLERRAETLARRSKPGQAAQVLGGVLEYLRGLTLPEVSRAARLGYYDLAEAAGVGGLVEPPKKS